MSDNRKSDGTYRVVIVKSQSFGSWYLQMLLVTAILVVPVLLYFQFVKLKEKVNEVCIFSIAFNDVVCKHKKLTNGRLPVKSYDEARLTEKWLKEGLTKDESNFVARYPAKYPENGHCWKVIGDSPYCHYVDAIREEAQLILEAPGDTLSKSKALIENSMRYYKTVGGAPAIKELELWASSIKAVEDKTKNSLLGIWRSTGCTNSHGGKTTECEKFNGMTIQYTHDLIITKLPNGAVQEKPLDLNKVTVSGNILKFPSGSSYEMKSADKAIFKWQNLTFLLEKIS